MKYARTLTVALAATALGLTGCANGDQEDPQEPEQTAAEENGTEDNGAEEDNTDEANAAETESEDPDAEEDSTEESEDSEEATEDDDASDSISVETEGQGPYGLWTADVADGEAQEVSGKLIIGPGSCMSLTDDSQPQLLVFGEDAEFVLREGQPGVSTDDLGSVDVGEQIELSAVEVSQDSVDGIPNQCAQGADDVVLVIN